MSLSTRAQEVVENVLSQESLDVRGFFNLILEHACCYVSVIPIDKVIDMYEIEKTDWGYEQAIKRSLSKMASLMYNIIEYAVGDLIITSPIILEGRVNNKTNTITITLSEVVVAAYGDGENRNEW